MFRNELIRVIGIGTKRSKWLLFTPLFNLIINNSTKYTYDDNEIENVFISFMKSRDGIAKRILLGMNIDIYEIVSHYNSSLHFSNSCCFVSLHLLFTICNSTLRHLLRSFAHLKNWIVFLIFIYFFFLGPHLWHMEVTRLGVELELQLRPVPQPQQCRIQAPSLTYAAACSNAGSLT